MTTTPTEDRVNLDGEPFDVEIKFCWIDEDGARISPVHKTILAALNYLVSWEDNKARIERQAEKAQEHHDSELEHIELWDKELHIKEGRKRSAAEKFDRDMAKVNEAKFKLTRTGKPPAQLRRLVTSTVVQTVSEDEQTLVITTAKTHGIDLEEGT